MMEKRYDLIRSHRKTMSVEISRDLRVVVRAPKQMKQDDIDFFIAQKSEWIDNTIERMKTRNTANRADNCNKLTQKEKSDLVYRARPVFEKKVAHYADIIGVTYKTITIRFQRTRWGSCSSNGNISLNCLLLLCPEEVMDYVIIHELCHCCQMNHSGRFWELVGKYCPNYNERIKWLREYGMSLMQRI